MVEVGVLSLIGVILTSLSIGGGAGFTVGYFIGKALTK